MIKSPQRAEKPKVTAESLVSEARQERRNPLQKLMGHKVFLVVLAVLVLAIAAIIWPHRSLSLGDLMGNSHAGLDKQDTCKSATELTVRNNCYRDLAFSMNQSYFCSKVFNSTKISDSCFAKLAIDANSKKSCEDIKDAKSRSYCISVLAVNNIELPLCDNVDDRNWKNYCYSQLAIVANKPDACLRIDASDQVANCYLNMAKNLSYGPTCAYISDSTKKDDCFLAVGTANSDELLCAEISEPPKRWTCYHRVAKKTGDILLCSHVPSPLNENCFAAVREAFPGRFNDFNLSNTNKSA